MRELALTILLAPLVSCSEAPRTMGYYETHPAQLKTRLDECIVVMDTSQKCRNADNADRKLHHIPARANPAPRP